ncbi:MAG: ABC transporter permease [Armatimonadetes bacterium]|nr:ABC transporter permease [Armatimonadota bacterium]
MGIITDVRRDNGESERAGRIDLVGEVLQDVGNEVAAVVSAPGEYVFRAFTKFFEFIGESSILLTRTVRFILAGRIDLRDTVNQMAFIGVASLPIVLVTVAFSGAVLSLYMSQLGVRWGFGGYTGGVIGLSVARELGPVLTAVVVTARSGSAIAAEIGTMKVTEQIDALRALAVSPVQYLVVPRLIAAIVMLPVLTIFSDIIGTVAGYLVAVVNGVAGGGYVSSLKSQVLPSDVVKGLVKTLFFAVVIVIVGAQQGLRTTGGATGVGRSTTSAVVISIVTIYILNFFLAYVMFGGKTAFL